MANQVIERRSQAILHVPVDHLPAQMILHDGTKSDVVLFVPAGETVKSVFLGDAFLPVIRNRNVCLVARSAIAALTVPDAPASELDSVIPGERQRVVVQFKSGATLEGEMRWVPPAGHQRTADHLNEAAIHFQMHADGFTHYVMKSHVALVQEK
jgi:hypothetical protein